MKDILVTAPRNGAALEGQTFSGIDGAVIVYLLALTAKTTIAIKTTIPIGR